VSLSRRLQDVPGAGDLAASLANALADTND
jgi:hypothetical protein